MKKTISLGVNDNPKYLYYIPLVVWAWKKLGWDVTIFFCGKMEVAERFIPDIKSYDIKECLIYDPYKSATISQVSRLYAACFTDGMIMTSDSDMLPLSDYWKPEASITTYGRDLTDYHYPICYIAIQAQQWIEVMNITSPLYGVHLRRDLRIQKDQWVLDQDIITENLLAYGKDKITHVNRGTDKRTGYPVGRVDRSNWRLDHKQLIDAHLPHDILTNDKSFHNVLNLLHMAFPKDDFKWYVDFHKEFKKLL